jgi:hypothetical protein
VTADAHPDLSGLKIDRDAPAPESSTRRILLLAAIMGALGGFFPSRNAARRVILEALREA